MMFGLCGAMSDTLSWELTSLQITLLKEVQLSQQSQVIALAELH